MGLNMAGDRGVQKATAGQLETVRSVPRTRPQIRAWGVYFQPGRVFPLYSTILTILYGFTAQPVLVLVKAVRVRRQDEEVRQGQDVRTI